MSDAIYHLPDIPDGFQIFEERLDVAGISYRREQALEFSKGRGLSLEFEREEGNPHDRNAIRVIGTRKTLFGTKRHFIGYVPAPVAAAIVEGGYYNKIRPRLLKTFAGESGYVEVLFQVVGPKGERLKYAGADPESLPQALLGKEAHYTDYVGQVKYLKQQKRNGEAIELLLKLVTETENEAKRQRTGVAPWYYEQLAILYRKEKRFDEEISILERFESQPKSAGVGPAKLAERLLQACQARAKNQA